MSTARLALVIVGDAMLVSALILILQIDKLVNNTLYDYGLIFSNDWAQPYWLMLRLCLAFIVIAILLVTLVELPYPLFEKEHK
jgi:hypothetical protein